MDFRTIDQQEIKRTLPIFEDDYEKVCQELTSLSKRLLELLPDPSIGPEERLERLARVAPHTLMISRNVRTARSKLSDLKHRLSELVPDEALSSIQKLEFLISKANQLSPEAGTLFEKLEELGDIRISDIGR
ncbi:hypothetical protein GW916_11945 [bacterium]|nr:hypothetical protein [bacterium]